MADASRESPPAAPLRTVDFSYIALWIMCCMFVLAVTIMVVVQGRKIDAIGQKQARRTGVVSEIQDIRKELMTLRGKVEERTMVVEQTRSQVLTNVLTMSRLEKMVDMLNARVNELQYGKPVGPPSAPVDPR